MKITKEKIIYFLSLNLVPLIPYVGLFAFGVWLEGDTGTFFYHIKKSSIEFILPCLIVVFPASVIVFIYSSKKNINYNIFMAGLFSLIPLLFFLLYIFITEFLGDYFQNSFLISIAGILSLGYLFSLIILKITDPLRRKIVW